MKASHIILTSLIIGSSCAGGAKEVLKRSAGAAQEGDAFSRHILVFGKKTRVQSNFHIPNNSHTHRIALETGNFVPLENHLYAQAMTSMRFRSRHPGLLGLAAGFTGGALAAGLLSANAPEERNDRHIWTGQ